MSLGAAWIAWSMWGISVGLVVLSVPLAVLNRFELGFDWAFTTVVAMAFSSVGGRRLAPPEERSRLDFLRHWA